MAPSPDDTRARQIEQILARLTLEERSGLAALTWDEQLATVARRYSERMAREGFVSHTDPDGRTPQDRVAVGHRTLIGPVAENLWMWRDRRRDPAVIAAEALSSWVQSPGHRRNLYGTHTHYGIGAVVVGDRVLVTQLFARAEAYLSQPLPECIAPHLPLDFRFGDGSPPVDYVDRLRAGDTAPSLRRATNGPVRWESAEPATYQLRFWVRTGTGRWKVVPGPAIQWGGCPAESAGGDLPSNSGSGSKSRLN